MRRISFLLSVLVPLGIGALTFPPDASDTELVLWLDSSDSGTLWQDELGTIPAASSQVVRRWDDKSLSGLVLTTNGGALTAPVLTGSVSDLGNVPAVTFSSDALASTTGSAVGISGNDDRTLVTVWQATNPGSTGKFEHIFHMGTPSGNQAYGHLVNADGGFPRKIGNHYWAGQFQTTVERNTDPNLMVSIWDADGGTGTNGLDSYYINTVDAGSNNRSALNTGTAQLVVGSRINPKSELFQGHLAEVLLYDRVLTDQELSGLNDYIHDKYGFTPKVPEPATYVTLASLLFLALRRSTTSTSVGTSRSENENTAR